jgi:hypothetical protein
VLSPPLVALARPINVESTKTEHVYGTDGLMPPEAPGSVNMLRLTDIDPSGGVTVNVAGELVSVPCTAAITLPGTLKFPGFDR